MYKPDKTKFREIEHTADIGIIATGNTSEDLFANAAFGMLNIICADLRGPAQADRKLELRETSLVELFVRWLSEINYLLTVHHFLTVQILQLQIKELTQCFELQAVLAGCDSTQRKNSMHTEIKAVTYHKLELQQDRQGYKIRVIFDI